MKRTPDPEIGSTFGAKNQITILSKLPDRRGGRDKMFLVKCSVCCEDPELFGDGTFAMTKGDVVKEKMPCGCGKKGKWTQQQIEVMILRRCKDANCEFLGFITEQGMHSKLHLRCNKHGNEWKTTTAYYFIKKGNGCDLCYRELIGDLFRLPDEDMISGFMESGSFLQGTKFKRVAGRRWAYICPVCSSDEYVKAGVCSGVFEADAGHLSEGCLSCRCSSRYSWTKVQQEYKLSKMLENHPDIKFIRWAGEYKNVSSRVVLHCEDHGEWDVTIDSVLRLGIHCPKCGNEETGNKSRIPQAVRENQINSIIQNENLPYKLLGWVEGCRNSKSRLRVHCDIHEEWNPAIMDFIYTGNRCPGCAESGYKRDKPAGLYVLQAHGSSSFTGYGISNTPDRRLAVHARNLNKVHIEIGGTQIYYMSGQQAWDLEKIIQQTFPLDAQQVTGFVTEATYYESYQDVCDFVDKWIFEST